VLAAGIGAVGLVGVIAWAGSVAQKGQSLTAVATSAMTAPAEAAKPQDAVLVFGSTGKLGRLVVQQLLAAGRNVVAAARSADKAEVFAELEPDSTPGKLFIRTGVDVTDASSLSDELLEGVTQIVSAVGPVFGCTPDGKMGYLDDMTSERVDAGGVSNIAKLAQKLPKQPTESAQIMSMGSADDLKLWKQLDDTIMGGQSSSKLDVTADGTAVWTGNLIVEGGGFCGQRTESRDLDLGGYAGVRLRVRGDGQTYKLNLKTADQESAPESTYQAQFDTVSDEWTTVQLPWHEFVPVKRAQVDRSVPVVNPAEVRQFGLVLSRFSFDGCANDQYRPGEFRLEIDGGIGAYRAPKPALIMTSTAAVERNAIIGDDEVARKADIPIVQLNPGGTLNHKYAGEAAVRAAGVPYAVVRPTGLTTEEEEERFLLEARQGDAISGKISRAEVAQVVARALGTPLAAGKTFELRRSEARDGRGKGMSERAWQQLFLRLSADRHRARAGLLPFPKAVPPPPPPSEDRTKEILSDDRVQSAIKAGRGGRVRSEQETGAAGSVTVTGDGRPGASPAPEAPPQNGSSESARAWVAAWRSKQAAAGNGAGEREAVGSSTQQESATSSASADQSDRSPTSAKEWIQNWRSRKH
jgi:uncharacterized protein YbjT (DUF2867 family)